MRKHHWGPCDEGFPIYHQKMLSVALKMKAKMCHQHRWPLFISLNATLRGANGMECIGSHIVLSCTELLSAYENSS